MCFFSFCRGNTFMHLCYGGERGGPLLYTAAKQKRYKQLGTQACNETDRQADRRNPPFYIRVSNTCSAHAWCLTGNFGQSQGAGPG